MGIDERANQLLLTGRREEGLAELRAVVIEARGSQDCTPVELARLLVDLSYQLRIDNVTGETHPEAFVECEALLNEAESVLESTGERPDGWPWLSWHTAARRLFIAQDRWSDAVSVDDRHLERLVSLDDSESETVDRLIAWREMDARNA